MFQVYAEQIEFYHDNQYDVRGNKITNITPLDGMSVAEWHVYE